MPALSQIRNLNIKVIFLFHLVFTSVASIGHWTPGAYLFYNAILISFIIWSMYQFHEEPLQMSLLVNGVAIILDILILVMRWPSIDLASEKFSAAIAIIHLLYRPFSIFGMAKALEDRSGSSGLISDVFGGARNPGSYEDIDRNNPPTATPQSGGYDFSTAQQI